MSETIKVFPIPDDRSRIEARGRWLIVNDSDLLDLATALIDYLAERGK